MVMRKISSLRDDHNVTVEQMAKDFGVTPQTVYNWQKAQPALDGELIIALANYFGVSSDELLGINRDKAKV